MDLHTIQRLMGHTSLRPPYGTYTWRGAISSRPRRRWNCWMIPLWGAVTHVPGLIQGTGQGSRWRSPTSCAHGAAYQQRHRLSGGQRRVMQDIIACRTAALGGQLAQCDHCGAEVLRYHSCQNRHCPKCQTLAKVLGGSASP